MIFNAPPDAKYTITLADGTKLTDLTLNGNNFISTTPITEDMFYLNTSPVIIEWEGFESVNPNMELAHISTPVDGQWWFILSDITDLELKFLDIQSKIEYLSMMTGVDFE